MIVIKMESHLYNIISTNTRPISLFWENFRSTLIINMLISNILLKILLNTKQDREMFDNEFVTGKIIDMIADIFNYS